jgi:hypothetical protein
MDQFFTFSSAPTRPLAQNFQKIFQTGPKNALKSHFSPTPTLGSAPFFKITQVGFCAKKSLFTHPDLGVGTKIQNHAGRILR